MSTARTPQPQQTATTGPPGLPAGPDRRLWARRVSAGLVVGGLAWSVAALLGPEDGPLRQFLTALLCAAATVLLQQVLALDRGLAEQARRTDRALTEAADTVRESLTRYDDDLRAGLTRYTEDLMHLVEERTARADRGEDRDQLPERPDPEGAPDLARGFAEVLTPGPAILRAFARREMKRVVGHLTDLTNLTAECPGENHDWMLTLTRVAEHSLCATSTSVDREFWNSEPASRYLQAQREAIEERGIPVRRLFVLQSAEELDDRLLRLCDEQESLDIEVRVAVLPELPPHLQRGTTNDFIVYDEEVTFEIEQDLREVNVRTRLNARQDHVQDRMKRFRELWEAGMGIRELEVRIDDEEDGTWMVDRG